MTSITGERLTSGHPRRGTARLGVTEVNGWVHVTLGLRTVRVTRGRFDRFMAEALPRPETTAADGFRDGTVPCELCENETFTLVISGRTVAAECTACRLRMPLLTAAPGGR